MIELVARKNRDDKRQIAYVRIDDQDFSVGNVPSECDTDLKVLDHLNSREDEIRLVMMRKMYPEADVSPFRFPNKTELKIFQDWIFAGCLNEIQIGQDEKGEPIFKDIKIEAQPLTYRIPKEITALAAIDSAKTIADLKAAIKAIIIGD